MNRRSLEPREVMLFSAHRCKTTARLALAGVLERWLMLLKTLRGGVGCVDPWILSLNCTEAVLFGKWFYHCHI